MRFKSHEEKDNGYGVKKERLSDHEYAFFFSSFQW